MFNKNYDNLAAVFPYLFFVCCMTVISFDTFSPIVKLSFKATHQFCGLEWPWHDSLGVMPEKLCVYGHQAVVSPPLNYQDCIVRACVQGLIELYTLLRLMAAITFSQGYIYILNSCNFAYTSKLTKRLFPFVHTSLHRLLLV